MRKPILLFAIVFVFSVLSNIGQTQVERTLQQRVAALEARVAQLESRFAEKPPPRTTAYEWSYIDEYGIKQPAATAEEIALAQIAAHLPEAVPDGFRLHALGDRGQAQVVGQLHRGSHDHVVAPVVPHPGDERSERELFEQAEHRAREMTREAVGELTSVLLERVVGVLL